MYANSVADLTTGGGSAPQDAGEKAKERRRNRARAARALAAEKKAPARKPKWEDARRKDDGFPRMPPLTPEQAKAARLQVGRFGWNHTRTRVALFLIDLATTDKGRRFQVSGTTVGDKLGISPASARYHLRKLTDEGWLTEVRKHTAESWLDEEGIERFLGIPAVRQLSHQDL